MQREIHPLIAEHRAVWQRKPVLRAVYGDLYRRIASAARPGLVLEVGGGSGSLKEFIPDAVSCDIVWAPWLDFVADAQALPLDVASVSTIVMLDVLHHIEFPSRLFSEAERVLTPGGRVVVIEPGITALSGLFYRNFHQEPVDMSVDPLAVGSPRAGKDPFEGNQAIPTLLAGRCSEAFHQRFPGLRITRREFFSLLAYPLSGGFKDWSLIPESLVRPLLTMENALSPLLGRWAGFRLMLVIEKTLA